MCVHFICISTICLSVHYITTPFQYTSCILHPFPFYLWLPLCVGLTLKMPKIARTHSLCQHPITALEPGAWPWLTSWKRWGWQTALAVVEPNTSAASSSGVWSAALLSGAMETAPVLAGVGGGIKWRKSQAATRLGRFLVRKGEGVTSCGQAERKYPPEECLQTSQ